MAELVDAPDLGSGFARSEGSSPFIRIFKNKFDRPNSHSQGNGFNIFSINRSVITPNYSSLKIRCQADRGSGAAVIGRPMTK
ncbi:MAG: hypothetical protein RLZZ135_849 [Cyanobacteriota bacterium]